MQFRILATIIFAMLAITVFIGGISIYNSAFYDKALTEIEEDISYARQFYNDSVLAYNNKCEMVPSNIIAGLFHFEKEKFFEASEEDRKNVKVEF